MTQIQPFFSSGGNPARRLLLISYHFPPSRATGSLRWEKLAAFASERGWGIDVVSVDPSCASIVDWPRLEQLPPGVSVYGVPKVALPVERLETWASRVRSRFRRPSAPKAGAAAATPAVKAAVSEPAAYYYDRSEIKFSLSKAGLNSAFRSWRAFAIEGDWAKRAAAVARQIIRPGVHEAVITCGPPHMVHMAGRSVARRAGIPFIMDLRDPWALSPVFIDAFASPVWLAFANHYERAAVEQAALVVSNTDPLRDAFRTAYPNARARMLTVMNGCDEDEIESRQSSSCFRIAYAGGIYIDRDPRVFFRAAAQVVTRYALAPHEFRIDFLGHVASFGNVPLSQIAREEGIEQYVHHTGHKPRNEALEFLAEAHLLLSLPQGVNLCIPSKIFEYFQFNAWVLALASKDSATERLLNDSPADVVEPDDLEQMTSVIARRYEQFSRGERPPRIANDERFSRSRQAAILFDAIEQCTRKTDDAAVHAVAAKPISVLTKHSTVSAD